MLQLLQKFASEAGTRFFGNAVIKQKYIALDFFYKQLRILSRTQFA